MNDISQTPMGVALHLPAETAMALALALSDPRVDIPHKRSAAAQAIDDLIAFLDETDGDADLEEDGDERDSSWPESHVLRHAVAGAQSEDDEDDDPGEDDGTAEPSLGSLGGSSYPWAEPLGWWRVKPYWLTDEEFAARDTPFITPMRGAGGQVDWARGAGSDLEDEHDGAEPDQEDGAAWSEGGSLIGKMDGGWPEDNEASLSLSESLDQSAAIADCQRDDWGVIDGEEDAGDAPEAVNEDGGNILDEPHDEADCGDREHSLCWNFGTGGATAEADEPTGWKEEGPPRRQRYRGPGLAHASDEGLRSPARPRRADDHRPRRGAHRVTLMRWLMLRRAIFLLRRSKWLKDWSRRDVEEVERLIRLLYPVPLPLKAPTSSTASIPILLGLA
jgi:hypothetical protein